MFENIPKHWNINPLSFPEISTIIMGQSPSSNTYNDTQEGLPFFQGKADFGDFSPTPRVWCSKPLKISQKDDILLSVRAPVGAINYNTETCCIGRGLAAIRAGKKLLPKYIYYFFKYYEPILKEEGSGAVFSAITKSFVEKIRIPVPPTLEEQQEIVDVLDAASEIIRLRTACIKSARSLIPALFQEMFGDPINNKKNLAKEKIGKILTLTSGKFIPSKELNTNGQYPVYGGNGINGYHNEFLFEDSKICIGRVGVKCGCVHKTKPNSWITDNALYINNYLIPINETYLKEALTQINLNQYAKRAAQPVISQTTIYNQYILLPRIEQQELFAAKVQEIEAYIKAQEVELENAKTMFQSLLHHSFTGELTRHKFGGDTNG